MFPIRDDAPRFGTPYVTVGLIVVNVAVFLYQFSLAMESQGAMQTFVETYGSIPLRAEQALSGHYPVVLGIGPIFTSIFLHGGWLHLIGNMWFLWIFGDNVEDELGHFAFLLFYLACGLIASLAHILANSGSVVPAVGASGAIAGVMGAYLVRFPYARIVTLVWIFLFVTTIEVPAALMLVYWFVIQFVSGSAETGAGDTGGVAWWAHVGGFVAGAILIWSRPKRRRYRRAYYH